MCNVRVVGAWTKAGVSSCVHVQGPTKADNLLLDCGYADPSTFSARSVLISHGHVDHAGFCINHARAVSLSSGPATYFVPSVIMEPMFAAKAAFEAMNGAEIPMILQAVNPGESFQATPNIRAVPFTTAHRVPSNGYALYVTKKGTLLPEYEGFTQEQFGRLRASGITSFNGPPTESLELVYTGDTTFTGLTTPENTFIFQAPILIMEVTYLDGKVEKALERGHIHLQDVIDNAHLFQNQQIVFCHLSQKYSMSRAIEIIRNSLPENLLDRVVVNLSSFGAHEPMTSLTDPRWSQAQRSQAGWGWSNRGERSGSSRGPGVYDERGYNSGKVGRGSSSSHRGSSHQRGRRDTSPRSHGRGGGSYRGRECFGDGGRSAGRGSGGYY